MKKNIKKVLTIILIILGIAISVIIIDTLQARIFKHSPFISWEEGQSDEDSWVDRGLLMDTYYCTKERDIQTIYWKLKGTKFICPVDNLSQLLVYEFEVDVKEPSKHEKIFLFENDGIKYYYGNTNFKVYITESNNRVELKESLLSGDVTLEKVLTSSKSQTNWVGNPIVMYEYDQFKILSCNDTENNKQIIIGDTKMKSETYCKEETQTFNATIIECEQDSMIVIPDKKEEEYKSSDKFRIEFVENFKTCNVNDKVKITYVGFINESYPAQIGTIKIEKVKQ